jgi:hypothetical protein
MGKYLVVTIDVEPDASINWQYSNPLDFKGVRIGVKKRLQPLFMEWQIVPTYLINNVVLEDTASVDILSSLPGKYELGAHLHPEFIEPAKKYFDYAGKRGEANCCYYPPEIESEKIKNITNLFEEKFRYRPVTFRAGRYGAGPNTIQSLARLGYLIDTSITPHLCWEDKSMEKPLDFRNAPEQPYWINENDITLEDTEGKLLEVPISVGLFKRNVVKELIVGLGGLRHELRKYKPLWLRPYYSSAEEMTKIAGQFCAKYEKSGSIVLNMMLHNVETLPGLSPYTKTESECVLYFNHLREFFSFCIRNGYNSIGLSELYRLFKR